MCVAINRLTSQPLKGEISLTARYASWWTDKNTYRYPFQELNVKRRNGPVATHTVYCDTSAIYDGSKCEQVFIDRKTIVSDVYGINSDKQSVNGLEYKIRQRGANPHLRQG